VLLAVAALRVRRQPLPVAEADRPPSRRDREASQPA
jgi:hypothetical protein